MVLQIAKLPDECKALLDCIDLADSVDNATIEKLMIDTERDERVIDRFLATETSKEAPDNSVIDRLLDNKNRLKKTKEFLPKYFKDAE